MLYLKSWIIFATVFLFTTNLSVANQSTDINSNEQSPQSLKKFFNQLEGNWQCIGASAQGTQTSADISFKQSQGEGVYTYIQQGTSGHTNTIASSWAFDQSYKNLLISRHYINESGASLDIYVGELWHKNKLVINAKALWKPLWAENRFTYEFKNKNSFKLLWEVNSDGWKTGDTLDCNRR